MPLKGISIAKIVKIFFHCTFMCNYFSLKVVLGRFSSRFQDKILLL